MSSFDPDGGSRRLAAVARRARRWSPEDAGDWPVQQARADDEDDEGADLWDDLPAAGRSASAVAFRSVGRSDGAPATARRDRAARVSQFAREHLVVLLVVLAVGAVFAVTQATRSRPESVSAAVATVSAGASMAATPDVPAEPSVTLIKVHVLGAVVAPGVVVLPAGARVEDAVAAAGGYREDADPALLNLASVVADGAQVVVGTTAAPLGQVNAGASAGVSGGQVGTVTLDLNTATQAQLEALPGIGPVKAGSIIAWRDQHGRFTATAELQEVDGIGPKTFAQLEPYVTV